MKKCFLLFLLPLVLSCDSGDSTIFIELIDFLDPTESYYQSPTFTVGENIPIGETIPVSTNLSFSNMTFPHSINPIQTLEDVESIKIIYEADLKPQEFNGTATLRLYIGLDPDLLNDPFMVSMSDTELLPATFKLETDDPKLIFIFEQDEIFIQFEYIIEPRYVNQQKIALGAISQIFRAEVVGGQTLR